MAYQSVATLNDLWSGELRHIDVGRVPVVLIRVGERVFAYEDKCAHLGVPLSEGRMEGNTLICSAHEWSYDVCTGHGINPRETCLRRYPVKIENDMIFIDIEGTVDGNHVEKKHQEANHAHS